MRIVTIVLVMVSTLAACGRSINTDAAQVCDQQSEWAREGKVDGGAIAITCPGQQGPSF